MLLGWPIWSQVIILGSKGAYSSPDDVSIPRKVCVFAILNFAEALGLGADAMLLGRPVLHALALSIVTLKCPERCTGGGGRWCTVFNTTHVISAVLSAAQALGLGADAVLLGRPVLHGLALDGQQGVQDVLDTLKAELRLNMALAGVSQSFLGLS